MFLNFQFHIELGSLLDKLHDYVWEGDNDDE